MPGPDANPKAVEDHKPILEHPKPQKSIQAISGNFPLKSSPSVSFSNSDQEKVRRFTISAQPSTVNLPTHDRKNLFQGVQSSVFAPDLASSNHNTPANHGSNHAASQPDKENKEKDPRELNVSSRNNSGIGSDILLFFSKTYGGYPAAGMPGTGSSSRVTSPVDSYQMRFNDQITPSPPPPGATGAGANSGAGGTPIGPSTVGAGPINVSRKNLTKKNMKMVVESPVGPPVPFQQYFNKEDDGKIHILLGATGSVATIKVPLIIDKLFQIYGSNKISIQLVITKCASHFLKGLNINSQVKIWRDEDEWANFNESINYFNLGKKPKTPNDKLVLHNELRKWADIMLLAPLLANTLAKIANGLSDNLLTSIVRSWHWPSGKTSITSPLQSAKKPLLVAPAMNTFMYTHPLTSKQLELLSSNEYGFGVEILKPVEKVLICGDIGMGGMREWSDIVDILRRRINGIKNMEKEVINEDENEEDEDDDDDEEEDDDEDDDDEDDDDDDDDDGDDEEWATTDAKRNDNETNDDMIFEIRN